jgi:exosortase/archaeosortase family protein
MSEIALSRTQGKVFQRILIVAAVTFTILPFVTTFNEFLTRVVESFQFVSFMQNTLAPLTVRIVAAILGALRIPVSINGSFLYLTIGWMPLKIYINWNCIGWQSFILLAFTFATGLQGPYTWRSRLIAILIGLEGTFFLNVVRIIVPTLLAYYQGRLQAIIFHDYLGTLFTLLWMGFFWNYAFNNVLVRRTTEGDGEKAGTADNNAESLGDRRED